MFFLWLSAGYGKTLRTELTGDRYGFIKYYNFVDAENCIRGFYYRGYEAKFAKVGPPPIYI